LRDFFSGFALDPSEVRSGLAKDSEFDIEKLLDDMDENELETAFEGEPKQSVQSLAGALSGAAVEFEVAPAILGIDRADGENNYQKTGQNTLTNSPEYAIHR
jgi:hypothetical protein